MKVGKMRRFCFECQAEVPDEPGTYYCPECVAEQLKEQGDELENFNAYHKWVDSLTKHDIQKGEHMTTTRDLTIYFVVYEGDDPLEATQEALPFDSFESADSYRNDNIGTVIYSADTTVHLDTLRPVD